MHVRGTGMHDVQSFEYIDVRLCVGELITTKYVPPTAGSYMFGYKCANLCILMGEESGSVRH